MTPPLKPATNVVTPRRSIIIFIPRTGRLLTTAKAIPASRSFTTEAIVRSVSDLSPRTSVPSTSEITAEILAGRARSKVMPASSRQ